MTKQSRAAAIRAYYAAKRAKERASQVADERQHRRADRAQPKACIKCSVTFWHSDRYQLRCGECQAALEKLRARVLDNGDGPAF